MKRKVYFLASALACGLLLTLTSMAISADEAAKVAGTWEMTSQSPRGSRTQAMTITQDGSTIKGTIKGQRGDAPLEGTVTGNKLSFTVKRDTPNGAFTIEYTGTVDGDRMKGKSHSERFDGEWSAKRASATGGE